MAKWWEERAASRDDNTSPEASGGDNWDKPANPSGDTGAKSPDNSRKGDKQ